MKEAIKVKRKKPFKKIIAISGRIGSGKSTLATLLSEKYELPIASFGEYLRYYSKMNNLPSDRKTLQDLGTKFIQKENRKKFLKAVIDYYKTNSKSEVLILEGVRHKLILKDIKSFSDETLAIFVKADQKIIYQRFNERGKESDSLNDYISYKEFDNHPIEFEIEQLILLSDFVLYTNDKHQEEELNTLIEKFLQLS